MRAGGLSALIPKEGRQRYARSHGRFPWTRAVRRRRDTSGREGQGVPSGGDIVGVVTVLETIAVGKGIRELSRLQKLYGRGRWRKMKGRALVRLPSGRVRLVELHWYEAHGIGRRELKRKRYLD
jgi:hypothetical protein